MVEYEFVDKIPVEEFAKWLETSKPRPVYVIGNPKSRDERGAITDDEWGYFASLFGNICDVFDPAKYGAYALLGARFEWVDHVAYLMPEEKTLKCNDKESIVHCFEHSSAESRGDYDKIAAEAEQEGNLNREFEWDDDPESFIRKVVRNFYRRIRHMSHREEELTRRLEAAMQAKDDQLLLPEDRPR